MARPDTDGNDQDAYAGGFHSGELAVQQRAGVRADAARLEGMLAPAQLSPGIARFLASRTYAALSARDRSGRLWVSPLGGAPGFMEAEGPARLRIHASPAPGDPLCDLPAGQPVGLLVIEYSIRRRVRVNGDLVRAGPEGLTVEIDQAYGNCPQYIPPHPLVPAVPGAGAEAKEGTAAGASGLRDHLADADRDLIRHADTFVLGTTHATRGNDASHRGGPPGFVHVERANPDEASKDPHEGDLLAWADYPGNNMFNSLGNLVLDQTAALLFTDFATRRTLHLSGTAEVVWSSPDDGTVPDAEGDTGRVVLFHPGHATSGAPLPSRLASWDLPHNTEITEIAADD
jgi:predicted pyridoxine 5'-phosphate oxidase superfamily flavin-nucleotide-binding protein